MITSPEGATGWDVLAGTRLSERSGTLPRVETLLSVHALLRQTYPGPRPGRLVGRHQLYLLVYDRTGIHEALPGELE